MFVCYSSQEVLIFGELDKWVPVSPQRVTDINISSSDLSIYIKGAGLEKLTFTLVVDGKWMPFGCVLSKAGTAVISLAFKICLAT